MRSVLKGRVMTALVARARMARIILAVGGVGVLTATCDVHGVSDPGSATSLSISPNPQTLAINGTSAHTGFPRRHDRRTEAGRAAATFDGLGRR